jgi:hypothetical protein
MLTDIFLCRQPNIGSFFILVVRLGAETVKDSHNDASSMPPGHHLWPDSLEHREYYILHDHIKSKRNLRYQNRTTNGRKLLSQSYGSRQCRCHRERKFWTLEVTLSKPDHACVVRMRMVVAYVNWYTRSR